ncbi:unnamed protein product [Macrosiphum euphorbiae]|uniref:Uncharacterized protein n=1 Tax=Macrosiphum euphorbiae TaxID=13131 RepID=A0AAV0VKR0_9HEMI|nr:unnamed protein product [Macrosiphum euphorbiae]
MIELAINQLRYQEVSDGHDTGRRTDGRVEPGNRTATTHRPTNVGSKFSTKKLKFHEDTEKGPAKDLSDTIRMICLMQDFTFPTRLPKYQTPIDQVVPSSDVQR